MVSTPKPRRWLEVMGLAALIALASGACSPAAEATVAPPSSTPAPAASPLPLEVTPLGPGTYSLQSFPVALSFEVPAEWVACSASTVEQSVCYKPSDTASAIGVAFLIVDNVVADPCSPGEEPLDPPVGPSVDDLVTAISGLEGFEATAPLEISVDGFAGKEFTVTAPADATCELKTWATANRTNGVGAGEVNVLRILDVAGTRILISGAYHPQDPAPAEHLAAIEQVMDSVRLQP